MSRDGKDPTPGYAIREILAQVHEETCKKIFYHKGICDGWSAGCNEAPITGIFYHSKEQ